MHDHSDDTLTTSRNQSVHLPIIESLLSESSFPSTLYSTSVIGLIELMGSLHYIILKRNQHASTVRSQWRKGRLFEVQMNDR